MMNQPPQINLSGGGGSGPSDGGIAQTSGPGSFLQTARHPGVCVAHLTFKAAAIVVFIMGNAMSFVMAFIFVTLLLAFDFWTVKNVTGRLLVALRWWNQVREDGSSDWVFESGDESLVDPTDRTVFWTALYVFPLVWSVFFFIWIASIDWAVLAAMGVVFGGANVVGYWKCSAEAKGRLQEWASSSALKAVGGVGGLGGVMGRV